MAKVPPLPVKRLLLVRMKHVRADFLEKNGIAQYVKEKPIPVFPLYSWKPQHGLSHYGYILEGLLLKDIQFLAKWEQAHGNETLLVFDEIRDDKDDPKTLRLQTVDEVLAAVGLQVNPIA